MTPAESALASLRVQTTGVSRLEDLVAERLLPGAARQHRLPLEGVRRTADFAWPDAQVALFVQGCFWHGHGCAPKPVKTNAAFWAAKVERNRARDADTDARLRAIDWLPLYLWECELRELLQDAPRGRQGNHTAAQTPLEGMPQHSLV